MFVLSWAIIKACAVSDKEFNVDGVSNFPNDQLENIIASCRQF